MLSSRLSILLKWMNMDDYRGIGLSRDCLESWNWCILDGYRVILLSRDCPEMCLATRTGIFMLMESQLDESSCLRDCLYSSNGCIWMIIKVSGCPWDCPESQIVVYWRNIEVSSYLGDCLEMYLATWTGIFTPWSDEESCWRGMYIVLAVPETVWIPDIDVLERYWSYLAVPETV